MQENFTSARLESTRKSKYLLKHLKNKTAKEFVTIYNNCKGEMTPQLRMVAASYKSLEIGSIDAYMSGVFAKTITKEEISDINKRIVAGLNSNYIYFYNSYIRKIKQGYNEEYVKNALADLKNAYSTYRRANNPSWNLEDSQITISEMENLYNILVPEKNDSSENKGIILSR